MVHTSTQSESSVAPLVTDIESEPRCSSSSPTLNLRRSVSFNIPVNQRHSRSLPEKKTRSPSIFSSADTSVVESPVVDSPPGEEEEEEEEAEEEEQGHPQKGKQTRRRFNPMLVLENSGSVARDHLASERTFLAYVRTSLAIASTGVALVQLFDVSSTASLGNKIKKYARPLGATSVCLGIVVLLIGLFRYFTVQQALTKGTFPVARLMTGGIALVLLAIITTVFAALIAGHR